MTQRMNPNRIVSPHNQHGWPALENEIKELFGLSGKAKWPDEGMAGQRIQNVYVWILSKAEAKQLGVSHRMRCVCPECAMPMSVGRLSQHTCKG